MMRYPHFDPCLVGQRNEEIEREVRTLRLEERLREHRGSRSARFVAFVRKGVLPAAASRGAPHRVTNVAATLGCCNCMDEARFRVDV